MRDRYYSIAEREDFSEERRKTIEEEEGKTKEAIMCAQGAVAQIENGQILQQVFEKRTEQIEIGSENQCQTIEDVFLEACLNQRL